MFVKTVFKTTFGLSDVLKITFSALYHVITLQVLQVICDLILNVCPVL